MKIKIPQINDASVTCVVFAPSGNVKKIWIETKEEEIDITNLSLEKDAEITINKLIKWNGEEE
ncbi:MAG: hypothetical protein M0Q91_15635 [Methanoregula sp.]|jgi:hypothetical protein|nr:hypothetical protein [Methanoregula sp.]